MKTDLLSEEWTDIVVNNCDISWLEDKGYKIPTHTRQLWCNGIDGKRVKNGVKICVASDTKLRVKRADLPPSSNRRMKFICNNCGKNYQTTWGKYRTRKFPDCGKCEKSKLKTTGCHSYWIKKLITDNPEAKCDISGERDKRFLVLHHLLSRKNGGKNEESNYVILSANYHLAFHSCHGGMAAKCAPEQYIKFKQLEQSSCLK